MTANVHEGRKLVEGWYLEPGVRLPPEGSNPSSSISWAGCAQALTAHTESSLHLKPPRSQTPSTEPTSKQDSQNSARPLSLSSTGRLKAEAERILSKYNDVTGESVAALFSARQVVILAADGISCLDWSDPLTVLWSHWLFSPYSSPGVHAGKCWQDGGHDGQALQEACRL